MCQAVADKENPPGLRLEGLKGPGPWGQKRAGGCRFNALRALRFRPAPKFFRFFERETGGAICRLYPVPSATMSPTARGDVWAWVVTRLWQTD
jgi:hypothetical protein